ncbi:phage tail assembly chaperone GT [Staphylococcus chromogenes]
MMKEGGKDINEILDMPFSFFMDVIEDGRKPVKHVDKKGSMLDAFTNL